MRHRETQKFAREPPHPPSFINIATSQAPTPGLPGQTESRNHSVLMIGLTASIPSPRCTRSTGALVQADACWSLEAVCEGGEAEFWGYS